MNNKKIFLLNFTLALILLASIIFINIKKDTPLTPQPSKDGSTVVTQEVPKVTIQDAYKNLIVKNKLSVPKSEFEMLWFYDNDITQPQAQLELKIGSQTLFYPSDSEKLVDFFKNYYKNSSLSASFQAHSDLLGKMPDPKYVKESSKYLFFNKNKSYFYNLATVYNMNNVCGLVFETQKSFLDVNGEKIEIPYAYVDAFDLLKKGVEFHGKEFLLGQDDYTSYLKEPFLSPEKTTQLLYTLASKYVDTRDESYKKLFYEKFNSYINKEFSYEEFSLFLELKRIDGETSAYCSKFHNEYFLGR